MITLRAPFVCCLAAAFSCTSSEAPDQCPPDQQSTWDPNICISAEGLTDPVGFVSSYSQATPEGTILTLATDATYGTIWVGLAEPEESSSSWWVKAGPGTNLTSLHAAPAASIVPATDSRGFDLLYESSTGVLTLARDVSGTRGSLSVWKPLDSGISSVSSKRNKMGLVEACAVDSNGLVWFGDEPSAPSKGWSRVKDPAGPEARNMCQLVPMGTRLAVVALDLADGISLFWRDQSSAWTSTSLVPLAHAAALSAAATTQAMGLIWTDTTTGNIMALVGGQQESSPVVLEEGVCSDPNGVETCSPSILGLSGTFLASYFKPSAKSIRLYESRPGDPWRPLSDTRHDYRFASNLVVDRSGLVLAAGLSFEGPGSAGTFMMLPLL